MIGRTDLKAWTGGVDRARMVRIADGLAVALAVSLPWSTTATGVLAWLWLAVLVPTLDGASLRRQLQNPAGGLPVLLCLLALIGILWAVGVPFKERLGGLSGFYKLLFIPLLMLHFQRSERGAPVMTGYLAGCGVLLAASWIDLSFPLLLSYHHQSGIVAKDHIAQGGEFGACALFLAPLVLRAWQERRHRSAIWMSLLALCFLANVIYIGTSRTGLVTTAALLALFAFKFLNWKARIVLLIAMVVAAGVSWPLTKNLRSNAASFVHEMQTYDPNLGGSRSGERLIYWQKSIDFVSAAPWIGHGTGSIRSQFLQSAEGRTGAASDVSTNPHNQTFAVAIQLGLLGAAVLFAMWAAHLALFWGGGLAAWFGLVVVMQNIIGSLFNSHLFDFTQGWSYVVGVGVAGGVMMKYAARAEPNVIRPATRHVAVIILYDAEGRMLLQHRTKDAPTFPDYWALFGGGIEAGETPEQAVKRECVEELAYELTSPRLFKVHALHHEGNDYVIHLFIERYNGAALTLGEGQGMGWFRADETTGLLVNAHDRAFINALAKEIGAED